MSFNAILKISENSLKYTVPIRPGSEAYYILSILKMKLGFGAKLARIPHNSVKWSRVEQRKHFGTVWGKWCINRIAVYY